MLLPVGGWLEGGEGGVNFSPLSPFPFSLFLSFLLVTARPHQAYPAQASEHCLQDLLSFFFTHLLR